MSTKQRCTHRQRDFLVDYMVANPAFARAEHTGPYSLRELDDEWLILKYMLREYGPDKPVLAWKRTWRELKKKARMCSRRSQTGSRDDSSIKDINSKILSVIVHTPVYVKKRSENDGSNKPDAASRLGSNGKGSNRPGTLGCGIKNSDFTRFCIKSSQLLKCGILQLKLETNLKTEQNNILRQRNELLKQSLQLSMSKNSLSGGKHRQP